MMQLEQVCSKIHRVGEKLAVLLWLAARQVNRNSLTDSRRKKKVVWPYHRRHLDLQNEPLHASHCPLRQRPCSHALVCKRWSHRWWLHSHMCCFSVIKAPRTPGTRRHAVPCKVLSPPPRPVTHNHSLTQILHVTNVRCEYSVRVCVYMCVSVWMSDHWQAWKQLVELIA